MNSRVEPHDWSKEALLNKAQLYAEEMLSFSHDDWQFALWSSLSLELLARAAQSAFSPILAADLQNWNNLLYALDIEPKAANFRAKSVDISRVLERLQELIPEFTPELEGFCKGHIDRRNEELHSGGTPFVTGSNNRWLPTYYRACAVLLESMGDSLERFLGTTEATLARKLIAAALDESAQSIRREVNAHQVVWGNNTEDEKERLTIQSSAWATRQTGHRVSCPACSCNAIVSGSAIAPPLQSIDGDSITETQEYLPSKFECVACRLKIFGLPQLNAVSLGNPYKATFTYDINDSYSPEDEYGDYEPDFNER